MDMDLYFIYPLDLQIAYDSIYCQWDRFGYSIIRSISDLLTSLGGLVADTKVKLGNTKK